MALSYKKLFKLLIDRDLKKQDLCNMANISTSAVTKLSKGQNVNTDTLDKICDALNCDLSDIVEHISHSQTMEVSNE